MGLLKAQINSVSNIIGIHLSDTNVFTKYKDLSESSEVYTFKHKDNAPIFLYFSSNELRIRLDRISHYHQFSVQEVLNSPNFKNTLTSLFTSSVEIQYYGKRGTIIKLFNGGKLVEKKVFADGWRGLFPTKILRYKPFINHYQKKAI